MPGKTRHLSKTDLRRGLFTKTAAPPAAAPPAAALPALPAATSPDEQALLFDLAPTPQTRAAKSVKASQ